MTATVLWDLALEAGFGRAADVVDLFNINGKLGRTDAESGQRSGGRSMERI